MPLILLDRDGVINENLPQSVLKWDEFQFIPGSLDALKLLHEAGIDVAICTNQSCVAHGYITENMLQNIHQNMCDAITAHGGKISRIYAALDHPDTPSPRRKPGPGMLQEAMRDFNASAENTPFIGDNITDLMAAYAASCPRVLVRTGHGAGMEESTTISALQPVAIFNDLLEATHHYLAQHHLPPYSAGVHH